MRQHRPFSGKQTTTPAAGAAAFTLLEMVMVLVALALVAAIAAPRYASSLANYRVDAAAKRVASDLAYVQAQARATSKSQTITYSPGALNYQVTGVAGLDNRAGGFTVNLGAEPYSLTSFSAKFGTKTQITFDQYGTPDNGGTVTVGVGTTSKAITVDAGTGKVTVK
jgi:prepilin-type N-terminal cleavage/methylation domain-containing protein